ncbi:MAG: hypothetical protein IJN70_08405 [Clostridia bacterium]|nr:hypothetical protein [Clostridia bacterium]
MKKKIFIISGIAAVIAIAVALCFVIFGNSDRTLEEITLGGNLRYELDDYTIVNIYFKSTEKNGDERVGTCYVSISYYKDAIYSPSGKVLDYSDTEEYDCTFTDDYLTLGLFDNYIYTVENRGDKEYVVFSKPFFGNTSWYVNK